MTQHLWNQLQPHSEKEQAPSIPLSCGTKACSSIAWRANNFGAFSSEFSRARAKKRISTCVPSYIFQRESLSGYPPKPQITAWSEMIKSNIVDGKTFFHPVRSPPKVFQRDDRLRNAEVLGFSAKPHHIYFFSIIPTIAIV